MAYLYAIDQVCFHLSWYSNQYHKQYVGYVALRIADMLTTPEALELWMTCDFFLIIPLLSFEHKSLKLVPPEMIEAACEWSVSQDCEAERESVSGKHRLSRGGQGAFKGEIAMRDNLRDDNFRRENETSADRGSSHPLEAAFEIFFLRKGIQMSRKTIPHTTQNKSIIDL